MIIFKRLITTNLMITMNDNNSLPTSQLCTAIKNQVEPKIKGAAKTKSCSCATLCFIYIYIYKQVWFVYVCLSFHLLNKI